jgi:cytochrome c peroxidase
MARVIQLFVVALVAVGCTDDFEVDVPADFPALPVPADNALTDARVSLGKRLFHDTQLSRTREVSCSSCHLAEAAFSDPRRFSAGVEGRLGTRNAPSIVNLAYNTSFFWDGGAPTLE